MSKTAPRLRLIEDDGIIPEPAKEAERTTMMTNSKQVTAISPTAAGLSIAAVMTYQVMLIGLIFIRPDLDPSWHTISE